MQTPDTPPAVGARVPVVTEVFTGAGSSAQQRVGNLVLVTLHWADTVENDDPAEDTANLKHNKLR